MTDNLSRKPFRVLAIDGGAASGKSSTSKELARRYNLMHVDTGSHYRAVSLACLKEGIEPLDSPRLRTFVDNLVLGSAVEGNESRICLQDSTPLQQQDLRSEAVNNVVSPFSALTFIREAVKTYQRSQVTLAREMGFDGIVMDGRDIGTVILPDADLKIFLVADTATRQRRRELEGATDTIADRDKRDASRKTAPLKAAGDAIVIDNSNLTLQEVVDRISSLLDELTESP
jgi:cytidylate kinase